MEVGRRLTLTSEQDTDDYDAKQSNMSAGGSASMGGGSLSLSMSRDKIHSTYASVQEQTGIFAGKGGFDVTVGEHTQLNAAVIGSTAEAGKNKLDTGTLGFWDKDNSAEYKVEHQSVSIGSGGSVGSQFLGNVAGGLLVGANGSGSASSTTKSAVSEGSLVIRDKDNQQQDVAGLNRDAEHANQTLSPIFNKEKEQNRLREAQLIGEIGAQAGNIAVTQGKIEATRAANEKMKSVTPEQLKAAKEALLKANPDKVPTDEEVASHLYKAFYDRAFADSDFGTGGKVQRAIQAATAAVQGLAGGDLAKAVAGGSAPYIANIIGNSGLDDEGKVLAHAAVNAALAVAQGNSALAGASGAATAELIGMIAVNAYGKPVSELNEAEKQTVSALATLAAGLAGGLTGDSSADVITAAQTGETTVENNFLHVDEALAFDKEMQSCRATGGDCSSVIDKYQKISDERSAELDTKCAADPVMCQGWDKELAYGGIQAVERPEWMGDIFGLDVMRSDEAKAYVQYWNSVDLAKIDTNSADWAKFAVFISDPENQAAVLSLGLAGKNLIQLAHSSLVTKSLFKEMTAQGIKFSPENIVSVARDRNGKIIFLETGSSKAGLQHIIEAHGVQFAQIGVAEAQIPNVVMKAVTEGKIISYQGAGVGRPIYETVINGQKYHLAVTVGNNGFIVGANLRGAVK